jgi:hypothetical protein
MIRTVVAGALLALVGVFAALALSVASTRRPLDANVDRSFRAVVPQLDGSATGITSFGCNKTSFDFYGCIIAIRPGRRAAPVSLVYRLWLTDDGCWTATVQPPAALSALPPRLRSRLSHPHGCVEGARRSS